MQDRSVDGPKVCVIYGLILANHLETLTEFTHEELIAVSYTHLDVYKRQVNNFLHGHPGPDDLCLYFVAYIHIDKILHNSCLLYTSRCV